MAHGVNTRHGPVPDGNPAASRAPGPSRKPGDEMKSTRSGNLRFCWSVIRIVRQHCDAIVSAPPGPPKRRPRPSAYSPTTVELTFP